MQLLPSPHTWNSNKLLQPLLQEILHEAEQARSKPLPTLSYSLYRQFEINGDRERYQRVYFARRGQLVACAIAAMIKSDARHIEQLQDTIWDICNEYTWCLPAHLSSTDPLSPQMTIDLFAAETAHTLAEILTLLGDRMDSSVQERIRVEIERRIFQPMCMEDVHFPWEVADHNWSSVCGGSVGMAAMLLLDDDDRRTSILNRVILAMECFMSGYGDDGGCAEGIAYWVYGFGYYVYFAEMLYVYSLGQLDLMNLDKVRAIAAYPEVAHLSDGVYANFSDAPERIQLPPGLLSRLSERTETSMSFPCVIPGFHDDPCYRWGHITRNLWWTNAASFGARPKEGAQWLDNLGVVIDTRTIEGMNVAFSAKGGHNNEAHNHNDLGHFILHADGNNLLIDLGHGLYTKEYFGEGRYTILNNSSAGHSVPIIHDTEQAAGESYHSTWLERSVQPNGSLCRLDLTYAYPESAGIRSYIRAFQWTALDTTCQLIIEDRFSFYPMPQPIQPTQSTPTQSTQSTQSKPTHSSTIEERFISLSLPMISSGIVEWSSESARLTLQYDKQQFTARILSVEHYDHAGEPFTVYITSLIAEHTEADFVSVLEFTISQESLL